MRKVKEVVYRKDLYPTPESRVKWIVDTYFASAKDFATRTHIDRPTISRILSGQRKLNDRLIDLILRAVPDISKSWLMDGEPMEMPHHEPQEMAELREKLADAERTIERLQKIIDRLLD